MIADNIDPVQVELSAIDRRALSKFAKVVGEVKRFERDGRFCCYHLTFSTYTRIFYSLKQLEAHLENR